MNPRQRMRAAMRRQPTDRIPTMPQICHDLPVRLYAREEGGDWLDELARCLEQPERIYDHVIRLVREVGCDGLRLFVQADPLTIKRMGDELIAIKPDTQERIGRIDTHGGGHLLPDKPEPPVETIDEARIRLEQMVAALTDDKLQRLRQARARVPDLFMASSPGGITLNTYNVLRGREQAMFDLHERPDFVRAVFEMQVDMAIRRGEKLLTTGIDALYIGDPSASASLISPQHFERFCLPAYQAFCKRFCQEALIYIHICGNSRPILEMMADTGAHVVEPLDPLGGVSVADAKRRIGQRVALMGGVNTITLSEGTAEQVRAEAIRKCREGGPYGYILAAGDMVPPATPLENLCALVDVASKSLWKKGPV